MLSGVFLFFVEQIALFLLFVKSKGGSSPLLRFFREQKIAKSKRANARPYSVCRTDGWAFPL